MSVHSKKTGEKLVVREPLETPLIREAWVLEFNAKKFGPAFKKNASHVKGYFQGLLTSGTLTGPVLPDQILEWNECKLLEFKSQLESGNGSTKVLGTDGNSYQVTQDMLVIEKRTEKVTGIQMEEKD